MFRRPLSQAVSHLLLGCFNGFPELFVRFYPILIVNLVSLFVLPTQYLVEF